MREQGFLGAALLVWACGGAEDDTEPTDPGGAAGASQGACAACEIENLDGRCVPNLAGCDDTGPYRGYYGDDVGVFHPIDSSDGIYLDGGTFKVPPGEEKTQCTYVKLDAPGDFVLGRYEVRMAPGSHHFNMLRYDASFVEAQGVELGKPIDCVNAGLPYYVAGSEWQYVDAPLPEGLGSKIPDGVVLEMQSHYVNTSTEPIEGRVEVNLYERDPADIEHLLGLYFNVMTDFEIAPSSSATFRARCAADEGVNVVLLTSHMHRFGQRFTVSLYDDAKGTRDVLYESTEYDHPLILDWALDPLVIGPNQGFEWSCAYENPTAEVVNEGEMGLTDEMCIMIAYYYDDPGGLPFCLQAAEPVP